MSLAPAGAVGALIVALLAPASLALAADAPARAIAVAEDLRRRPDLEPFLADADPAIRARAALAVGRLQDSASVAVLLPLLRDRAPEVRREAVFALGQIGHRSARPALEQSLGDIDEETVELSIEALGKLGDKAATARVASLLGDPLPRRRRHAAVALWRLADSTALGALLARHSDPDLETRWRTIYALEKIVAPDRIVLVVATHLQDPEWLTRAYAARTLGRQKSARAGAYLLQALADGEPAVVVNAIRAIQFIADSACARCAAALAERLDHGHPYVRVTAATALAERASLAGADSAGRAAALAKLAAHLVDPDAATRGACARALLRHRGVAGLDEVRPLLADTSLVARTAALSGLAFLPADAAARELLPRLEPRTALFERMTAADLLGEVRARAALPALRAGLRDTSALYVASVAGALAALGDSASIPVLARAYAERARDADADARIAIRDALRQLAGAARADSIERRHPAKEAVTPIHPDEFASPPAARGVVLHLSGGDVEWAFFGGEAPQTVKNFVRLAERGYYDGVPVHRVVPNFVVQDGDPTGTGSGGPGYTIRCEYNRLRYDPGMVGMALSGKDTGGSQWFVNHSPQPHLDGRYTIFARVVRGMDVVARTVQGDRVLKVDILR